MRIHYQPAALEEFRQAIIWYAEVAGLQQAEALELESGTKPRSSPDLKADSAQRNDPQCQRVGTAPWLQPRFQSW